MKTIAYTTKIQCNLHTLEKNSANCTNNSVYCTNYSAHCGAHCTLYSFHSSPFIVGRSPHRQWRQNWPAPFGWTFMMPIEPILQLWFMRPSRMEVSLFNILGNSAFTIKYLILKNGILRFNSFIISSKRGIYFPVLSRRSIQTNCQSDLWWNY